MYSLVKSEEIAWTFNNLIYGRFLLSRVSVESCRAFVVLLRGCVCVAMIFKLSFYLVLEFFLSFRNYFKLFFYSGYFNFNFVFCILTLFGFSYICHHSAYLSAWGCLSASQTVCLQVYLSVCQCVKLLMSVGWWERIAVCMWLADWSTVLTLMDIRMGSPDSVTVAHLVYQVGGRDSISGQDARSFWISNFLFLLRNTW